MIIEVHGTVRGFTNVRARVGKTCVLLRVFFSCVTFVFLRVPRVCCIYCPCCCWCCHCVQAAAMAWGSDQRIAVLLGQKLLGAKTW